MARKNPIGKLTKTAVDSIKDPFGAAGKVAEQAKGTAALGKVVAEQIGRTAVSVVTDTAGSVVSRAGEVTGLKKQTPADVSKLRPVPDVNQPAPSTTKSGTAKPEAPAAKKAAKGDASKTAESDPRPHGDPMREVVKTAAKKAPAPAAKKAPAPAAKKVAVPDPAATAAPAATGKPSEAPTKNAPAPAAKKASPAKSAAKSPAKKATKTSAPSPLAVAEIVEAKIAEDPSSTAAVPAKSAAPAAKAPAEKSAPGAKLPSKKAAPASADEVAAGGPETTTTAGTTGAAGVTNPDTGESDAQGQQSLLDPSLTKAVASEAKTMSQAAETDPIG